MIQQALLSAFSSPHCYAAGSVTYLQTKHFQRRLLKVLPAALLDAPVAQIEFIDPSVKAGDGSSMSLKELLSLHELAFSQRFGVPKSDVLRLPDRTKPEMAPLDRSS
jgi:hypothetical protein